MAEHEVPFTRTDMMLLLTGRAEKDLHSFFMRATEGQLKSIENVHGEKHTPSGLFSRMVSEPKCYFYVPDYFWTAWKEATTIAVDRYNDTDVRDMEKDELRFMGAAIRPWEREFIVAHIDFPVPLKVGGVTLDALRLDPKTNDVPGGQEGMVASQ